MIDSPHVTETAEQLTAVIRLTIRREEIQNVMGPGLRELTATLIDQGISPAGAWFTHHLKMDPEVFDFEIGIPVATPVSPTGRVKPGCLPATRVARTVYHGPYEGLAGAWGEFTDWIDANGHTPATNLWEVYAAGPESDLDPNTWCTELNQPLIDQNR